MEVVNENVAQLTNYEVMKLLTDVQNGENGQRRPNKKQSNVATIVYSTLKYLQQTPCSNDNSETLEKLMEHLEPFKLTKAERLMLINNRPASQVEVQLMIEECEERFSDEQVDQMISILSSNKDDSAEQNMAE